jgi:hypothetical protein
MVFDGRSSTLMCGKARLSKFMATVPDRMTLTIICGLSDRSKLLAVTECQL